MNQYISIGEFQDHLKNYYNLFNIKLNFFELSKYLYENNFLSSTYKKSTFLNLDDNLNDEEFFNLLNQYPIEINLNQITSNKYEVCEDDIIPSNNDVYVIKHFRYLKNQLHSHNYFEINYVYKGSCNFYFENDYKILNEGELCIISPHSTHDIEIIDDDSIVITILIRKSTFDTTFFSLLSQKDLLSYFFRNILYGNNKANYLLFSTESSYKLKNIIRDLTLESFKNDTYSNNCGISYINLLFSHILRNYNKIIQLHDYNLNYDFSLILNYIQKNYKTLTLSKLTETFHYSVPHLSTLIKKNTGLSYSELIKKLKMSDAIDYLENTDLSISEIAKIIGYNSSDHFSRVFKSCYHISPQYYRTQKNRDELQ